MLRLPEGGFAKGLSLCYNPVPVDKLTHRATEYDIPGGMSSFCAHRAWQRDMLHRIHLQSEIRTILTWSHGRRDSLPLSPSIASVGSPIISSGGVFLCPNRDRSFALWRPALEGRRGKARVCLQSLLVRSGEAHK